MVFVISPKVNIYIHQHRSDINIWLEQLRELEMKLSEQQKSDVILFENYHKLSLFLQFSLIHFLGGIKDVCYVHKAQMNGKGLLKRIFIKQTF